MAYIRKAFLDLDIVKIENVEILENEISLGRWLFDALLLIMHLGESCNLQKQIDIGYERFRFIPDMYLEKGCKSLNIFGRTIIEIRKNLLIDTEIKQVEIYRKIKDNNAADKIILLYINPTNPNVDNLGLEGCVDFINANDFIIKTKKAINERKGDIFKQQKLGKKYKSRRWVETRKERLANAINDLKRYDCALFLGAGVSVSANMPSWNKLLKELVAKGLIINQKVTMFAVGNAAELYPGSTLRGCEPLAVRHSLGVFHRFGCAL